MSLINQALKMEQQRRRVQSGPIAPMVSRAARSQSSNLPLVLIGFTCVGLCLAAFTTAFLYFGSQYLGGDSERAVASAPASESEPAALISEPSAQVPDSASVQSLMDTLSPDQLSTVQKMLLERQQDEAAAQQASSAPVTVASSESIVLAQETVNAFTIQGIRKAGKDTRVFLNGRIQRLGDVVDVATGVTLIGFNDFELIFADPSGNRYTKAL